ncbi:MAG: hydrogenase expression/formation protein HypE [Sandaracinaceae bacterium]
MSDDDACPVPASRYSHVVLGHGSGGRLGHDLLHDVFLAGFGAHGPDAREDASTVRVDALSRIAVTTDAFVVHPRTFPGGDLGSLAVYGTVNDLAVAGARPEWLTAAFILEEGLPIEELRAIVESMRIACERAHVVLVAGDTKVVDRGKGDGVFVTTTGVGRIPEGRALSARNAQPGDVVLVSGTMGDHGVAVMSARLGLELEGALASDAAPIHELCDALLAAAPNVRCMRDPTRGGLAAALNELASASAVQIELDESHVPVNDAVRGACEILGIDPLYVANEGKLVAIVPEASSDAALAALRAHPLGQDAARVGRVVPPTGSNPVIVHTALGTQRVLPLLSGEALPRIC